MSNVFVREIKNTPIGSFGALCGTISLAIMLFGLQPENGQPDKPISLIIGIDILISIGILFLFSFVSGKILQRSNISSYITHALLSIVCAAIINGVFYADFPERYTLGGPTVIIMLVIGLLISSLYQVVFIERLYFSGDRVEWDKVPAGLFYVLVAIVFIQTLIIAANIYIPG